MNKITKIKNNFSIVPISEIDAKMQTDRASEFKELILSHEQMYPSIEKWYKKKVIPGIITSERVGFLGYYDNKPAVSAIVKRGDNAKFCHLHLRDDLRDSHVGEIFFALMAKEVRHLAKEIHFTLPESLWLDKRNFFESFGFKKAIVSPIQYRLFEEELLCSTPFENVWNAIICKLPSLIKEFSIEGFSSNSSLLMSIHSEYAKNIITGKKRVEIRRKFSKKWDGHKINIYASRPTSGVIGEARIKRIVKSDPESIWTRYKYEIGTPKDDYDKYVGTARVIYAIELNDVKPYLDVIPLSQLNYLLKKNLKPPQSYCKLDSGNDWSNAITVATLLQRSFHKPIFIDSESDTSTKRIDFDKNSTPQLSIDF